MTSTGNRKKPMPLGFTGTRGLRSDHPVGTLRPSKKQNFMNLISKNQEDTNDNYFSESQRSPNKGSQQDARSFYTQPNQGMNSVNNINAAKVRRLEAQIETRYRHKSGKSMKHRLLRELSSNSGGIYGSFATPKVH